MGVSGAARLNALEDEDAKPKRLLAEAVLDDAALEDLAAEMWWRPRLAGPPRPTRGRRTGSAGGGPARLALVHHGA